MFGRGPYKASSDTQTAPYHLYSLAVDFYSVGVLSLPVEELDTRSSVSPLFIVSSASVPCSECSRQPYQCNIW